MWPDIYDSGIQQTNISLTLFHFNFLSTSLLTSFIIFYLSSTPDEDHVSKALVMMMS